MLIGYMRVSKADGSQATDLQRDALVAAGVDPAQLYEDQASGKREDRPGLASCLKALRPGDTLVVWKLDRLARSLKKLITTAEDLEGRGIGLVSLTESIDTTTPGGVLGGITVVLYGMIGLLNSGDPGDPSALAAQGSLTSVFGNDGSVQGNMWGSEIGDAYGVGGLGLSGVGTGGGGTGEGTIGLGSLGTMGWAGIPLDLVTVMIACLLAHIGWDEGHVHRHTHAGHRNRIWHGTLQP